MTLSRLVLTLCLVAGVAQAFLPPVNWGQGRPTLDSGISPYASQGPVSGELTISVPETMMPLIRAWGEDVVLHHPNLTVVTLAREAADASLAVLLEHRAEAAAMPRRITVNEIAEFVKEYGYEPTEVPVANDALAIFVHKDNPVAGLSLDELDAMFCRERRRGLKHPIDSWGLVGVMDEWFETPVRLHGRNGKSAPGYFFREEVCKGGTFHPRLADAHGPASVIEEVERDTTGIGFSAIAYRTSMVKAVPIASVKGGRYVEPSLRTAMDGSYPLRRNLYLYVAKPPKADPATAVVEFIRYVLSRQGQTQALDFGYLPLSSAETTRLASKWSTSVNRGPSGDPEPPMAK